jgi:hypothetical protein
MFTGTLPENAQKSLAILGANNCLPPKTYLAGGSGLALFLGHRVSVDFDFFTSESFNQEELAKSLAKYGKFDVSSISKDTLLGIFNDTKFSIFRYQYPLIFETSECLGINVADKIDIAAMKIAAIMGRSTKKDFIDLYFLAQEGISLRDSLKYYDQKYGVLASNLYSIITSLVYFTEAEGTEMPKMIKEVSWEDVKRFFEKESVGLTNK